MLFGITTAPPSSFKWNTGLTNLEMALVLTLRSGEAQTEIENGTRLELTSPRDVTETYPSMFYGWLV
jgi:hypothetical protein